MPPFPRYFSRQNGKEIQNASLLPPSQLHKRSLGRLMADPQDRLDIVRLPIEKLGGKLHSAFFAFGEFGVIAITEMPDNMSAAAIAIAFAAGGAVAHVQTTPLMTAAQAIEALKKAGSCGYKSIVAGHGAAAGA